MRAVVRPLRDVVVGDVGRVLWVVLGGTLDGFLRWAHVAHPTAVRQLQEGVRGLVRFYYRRLEHVRTQEGRDGERLRLWDKLGELCNQLGRTEDAVAAFEVALSLTPNDVERRQRLADLYLDADPKHAVDAIVQHQAVLRTNKRRIASYKALRELYGRTKQIDKARACRAALQALAAHVDDKAAETVDAGINKLFADEISEVGSPPTDSRAPLGAEDTTSPFAVVWNSAATTDATHVLTAVARDGAGAQEEMQLFDSARERLRAGMRRARSVKSDGAARREAAEARRGQYPTPKGPALPRCQCPAPAES